jgi:methylglutamate dehydrogenase subunit D
MLDTLRNVSQNVPHMSAFGDWPGAAGEGLAVSERRGLFVVELAAFGWLEADRAALAAHLGIALPAAGHSTENSGMAALSMGPRRWLLVAPEAAFAALPDLPETQAAVTDLTGGRAILALAGPRAAPTLMKGAAIDLDPAAFPEGAVAATALARMPAIIWRRESGYDVIVPRSYAASLLEWLLAAGGLEPVAGKARQRSKLAAGHNIRGG